jgi:hypothetical protein
MSEAAHESSPAAAPLADPLQAFGLLQGQVELAVAAIDRLRGENERLSKELANAQEMLQLTQDEVDRLVLERGEVCQRIEHVLRALGQADLDRTATP